MENILPKLEFSGNAAQLNEDHKYEQETTFREIDKLEEMKSLQRVLDAYIDYRGSMEDDIIRWERSYNRLTPSHRALVPELPAKYAALRKCADQNALLIDTMLQAFDAPFGLETIDELGSGMAQMGGFEGDGSRADSEEDRIGDDQKRVEASSNGQQDPRPQSQAHRPGAAAHASGRVSSAPSSDLAELERNQRGFDSKFLESQAAEENLLSGQKRSRPEARSSGREPVLPSTSAAMPADRTPADGKGGVSVSGEAAGVDLDPWESDRVPLGDAGPVHTHANGQPLAWGSTQAGGHFHQRVPPSDVEKVRCVLRNIVRDWTSEGAAERSECYAPILAELQSCFPDRNPSNPPSCVVPGAGLGRLACEVSRLGFVCQGNEFSYYTLIVSSFILNMTDAVDEWVFYPWIHSQCNTQRDEDMLRPVMLPDLHPGSAGITDGFSMCAGDFLEVYGGRNQAGAWDSIVTCFFIDTAHNVIAYLEVIARILKPGGVWINFGPLLYHFADAHQYSQDDDLSVELSLETILRIAASFGLTLKSEPQMVPTSYTGNPRSMMTTKYTCAFWTMTKT